MSEAGPAATRWSLTMDNPWDAAHHAVTAGSATYAEPDYIQFRATQNQGNKTSAHGLTPMNFLFGGGADKPHEPDLWGPAKPQNEQFSPLWYLDRAGFSALHKQGIKGANVRIAHLDTGCYPKHQSTPRYVLTNEGHNFFGENPKDVVDTNREFLDPGHGTATIALLAGNSMDLDPQPKWGYGNRVTGEMGGAPDAYVIPVVIGGIGGSVVHIGDSSVSQGLLYALGSTGRKPCDVVSISHGGYPCKSWADAVNQCYDAGIIVVAAAGDWIREGPVAIPPHYTIYPSAFWRVITATGITFNNTGYQTPNSWLLQGSYGPDLILDKSIAAYTPNVPWMKPGENSPWDMSGGGTSAAAPQIAAACALWIQKHGHQFPADWSRVEACRYALIRSARPIDQSVLSYTSKHGELDVEKMLAPEFVTQAIEGIRNGSIKRRNTDRVSWSLIRYLIGSTPPGNPEMYEVEAVQTVFRSTDNEFIELAYKDWQSPNVTSPLGDAEKEQVRDLLVQHDISNALRMALQKGS